MKKSYIVASLVLSSALAFSLDLGGITKSVMDNVGTSTSSSSTTTKSNLDNATVSSGLKEALKVGVNYAVSTLGANNGYLNSSSAKIPLPDNLAKAESLIRKAGGNEIVDNLINSMNSAATKAAPKTADIFISAIEKMSLTDAQKILGGSNDAATNYFKTNTTDSLKKMIKPIIQETMQENQVAKYYDMANGYYKNSVGKIGDTSAVSGLAKNFGVDSYIPGNSDTSIDDYVTNKAIDGLFKMIATKEADIRSNPVSQTTSLLKQVFGK